MPIPTLASPYCVPRCQRRAVPHTVPSWLPGYIPRQLQHRPADALPVTGKAALSPQIPPWSLVTPHYLPS